MDPVKSMLQELDAVLVSYGYSIPLHAWVLVRRFPKVVDDSIEAAIAYADANISADNAGVTIGSPKAAGSKQGFSGTWRLLRNDRAKNATGQAAQGMVQTLVKAMPWTILAQLTAKGGALAEYTDFFFNLTEAEAAAFALGSGSPEGWDNVAGRPAAGWTFQLSDPTLNPEVGTYSLKRVRRNGAGDLTGSGSAGGKDWSDEHYEDDALVEDLERHTGQALPLNDVAFTPEGTTVRTRNQRRDDLLYDTAREQRDSKAQEVAEHDAGASATETVRRKTGRWLRLANLSGYLVAPSDGEAVDLDLQKNNDATHDAVLRKRRAVDVPTFSRRRGWLESVDREEHNAAAVDPDPTAGDGEAVDTDVKPTDFRNRKATSRAVRRGLDVVTSAASSGHLEDAVDVEHTASPIVPSPAAGDGQRASVEASPTEYVNRWRTRRRLGTARDVVTLTATRSAAEASAVESHSATASMPSPARGPGEIVDVDADPTEFLNRWRTRRTVRTAINQTAAYLRVGALETVSTATESQNAAIPDAAPGDGQQADVDASPTPYGWFATRRAVRTAHDAVALSAQLSAAEEVAIEEHSATAAEPAASRVPGQIVETSRDPLDYVNRWRTRRTIRTALDQVGYAVEEDQFERRSTETHTQAETAPSASFAVNRLVEVSDQPTAYGRRQTTARTREGKPYDSGWTVLAGGHSITATRELRNWPTQVVDFPLGIPRRVSGPIAKNTLGSWDMMLTADYDVEGGHSPGPQYKAYATTGEIGVAEHMTLGDRRYKRTRAATFKACGNKDPGVVMAWLAGCNNQVSFNPQADGRFFHGLGILVSDETADWTEDMSGVTP